MSIVKEKFDGLRQNITPDRREYSCTYICRGVTAASSFPASFRWECQNLSDPFARLVGLGEPRQLSADLCEITANYSTLPADLRKRASEKDQPANPLARRVRRRWSTGYLENYPPADLSAAPKAFCVSTGEPIRGGVPVKIPYLVKHYVRNEAYFNPTDCLGKIWHMDSTRKILCARYDGSEEYEDNGVAFVEVNYEFWCLESGGTKTWDELRLDAGSYWLEYEEGEWKVKYLEDKDGVKSFADGSIPLDGAKGRLTQVQIDLGAFKWNTFQVYGIADFSSLGLTGL